MLIAYHQVLQRAKFMFVGTSLFAFLIFIGTFLAFLRTPLVDDDAKPIHIVFPMGSSVFKLAHQLHVEGLLHYPEAYIVLTSSLMRASNHLHAGEYEILPGTTPMRLINKMILGEVIPRDFLFLEGWTLKQLRAALDSNPYLIHRTDKLTDKQLASLLKLHLNSLEGVFFPDTYRYSAGLYDTVILKAALEAMEKNLQKVWDSREVGLPYKTPYDLLIVASRVEKEAMLGSERPRVAGVILKRLHIGMPLQIDATVIYGLGDQYDGNLKLRQLKIPSPYNSYLNLGLPPTPIAMPGEASLTAAAHPIMDKNLYYVARGDGSHGHVFSPTYEGQDRAVKAYHRNLRER